MFNRYEQAAGRHYQITPSDSAPLPVKAMRIYVGGAGNIKVDDTTGASVTYAVVAGAILPVLVNKVYLTGTTATGIVGLV